MQTTSVSLGAHQFEVPVVDLMRIIVERDLRTEREERAKAITGLFEGFSKIVRPEASAPAMPTLLANIGDELQGGWYAGPMFNVETGRFEHKIAAKDLASTGTHWDNSEGAAKAYSGGGHDDWRLPTVAEGHLLQMYLQPMGKLPKRVCWTSTPYGSYYAWALAFEYGGVYYWDRCDELAVLPVRSIIA